MSCPTLKGRCVFIFMCMTYLTYLTASQHICISACTCDYPCFMLFIEDINLTY